MLRALFCCGLLALLSSGAGASELREAGFAQDIAPEEVLRLIIEGDGPLVVDARPPRKYAKGHVPGAWNVYNKDIWGYIPDFEKHEDRGIVFYCESGLHSRPASQKLIIEGFRKIFLMRGNFPRWKQLGYPLEDGDWK